MDHNVDNHPYTYIPLARRDGMMHTLGWKLWGSGGKGRVAYLKNLGVLIGINE